VSFLSRDLLDVSLAGFREAVDRRFHQRAVAFLQGLQIFHRGLAKQNPLHQ